MKAIELLFAITPVHTEISVSERLDVAMTKYDQQVIQLTGYITRFISPLLFVLGLIMGAIFIYFPERQITPGNIIAFVLSAAIIALLWRLFIGKLVLRAARRHTRPSMYWNSTNRRLHQRLLRISLKRTEGLYSIQFDNQGFTLTNNTSGARAHLPFAKIVSVRETRNFYFIASAEMVRKNKSYCIPRNSDVMEPSAYQQGLALFLGRIDNDQK